MSLEHQLVWLAAIASLWMLGVTRIRSMLWGLFFQGLMFGVLLLQRGWGEGLPGDVEIGIAAIAIKAMAIPIFLNWSAIRLGVARDRAAGIAPGLAMLLGLGATAVCYFRSDDFAASGTPPGLAGLAVAIVLVGLAIMLTRRLAIGMLIGFLVLDNGIFAYAFTQTPGMPTVIELGILFDLFVGVLLAGLVLLRVHKSFEHIDLFGMRELRE